jgi:hypothetical protein
VYSPALRPCPPAVTQWGAYPLRPKTMNTYPPSSSPSIARLVRDLQVEPEKAPALKRLLKRGPEAVRGCHPSHAVVEWLGECEKYLEGTFGVESCYPEKPWLWYLNAGDTYATTLIYDERGQGKVRVGCWGDYFGA